MSNSIVSVRIPNSLGDKLKTIAKKQHYLDVSEFVRTLLRKKRVESKKAKFSKRDLLGMLDKLPPEKYNVILKMIEGNRDEK